MLEKCYLFLKPGVEARKPIFGKENQIVMEGLIGKKIPIFFTKASVFAFLRAFSAKDPQVRPDFDSGAL